MKMVLSIVLFTVTIGLMSVYLALNIALFIHEFKCEKREKERLEGKGGLRK